MTPRSILYLHGFASSPFGEKPNRLGPLLAADGIVLEVPDLNVPSFERLSFAGMVERAVDAARRAAPDAIVGSSLGALVALAAIQEGITVPAVLIAPGIGIAELWVDRLPPKDPVIVFNHARKADTEIHRAFFEEMATVAVDRDPPPVPVTVLMGRKDQVVPFDEVRARWEQWARSGRLAPGSRFVEIGEGDHGLTAFIPTIADEIRRSLFLRTATQHDAVVQKGRE